MSRWLSLALEVATARSAVADTVPIAPIVPIAKPEVDQLWKPATHGRAIGTNGTIGTTLLERVHLYEGRFSGAIAALSGENPTPDETRWQLALSDALAFLTEWGSRAEALGWTEVDLFGLHPQVPLERYDAMGLLWLLKGRRVRLLFRSEAVLADGLRFRKSPGED